MSDENFIRKVVPIDEVKLNDRNPRIIKDDKFKKLVKSLQEFPEMLDTREVIVNKDMVVLGGNQRLRAAKEAGITEIPIKIVDWDEERQKEFIVKDNLPYGEWDWDILANEWEIDDLKAWGVDGIPKFETDEDVIENASLGSVKDFDEDTTYDEESFVREQINPDILADIDECVARGTVRPSVAECLKKRAEQCTIFNFDQLTKFYRSDDPSDDEKRLLRRLYLVFEVPKKLFDEGILKLNKFSQEIYDDELTTKES